MSSPVDQSREIGEPQSYQPFDGPLRWLIQSRTDSNVAYLVDLGAYGCRGECQCPWWRTTVGPKVKKGQWRTCFHINMANERYLNWSKREFAKRDTNTKSEHL